LSLAIGIRSLGSDTDATLCRTPPFSTAPTDNLMGRTLSRFRVISEIGRGGMGIVYRAFDETLERELALKVLRSDRAADRRWRLQFLREARTVASLENPYICVIHEVGEAAGRLFIAMELIRGEALVDTLRRGRDVADRGGPSPLPTRRALELAREIAQGLALAHDRGIVHLDIKPSNIMVTDSGHAKLIDFGLAASLDGASGVAEEATPPSGVAPRHAIGTPAYMSPEQMCGLPVDQRSDIFAFGVLLHEMLTGANPFRRLTYAEMQDAVLNDPVSSLELIDAASGASGIRRVLDRCLAKVPRDRYQDMGELLADLGCVGLSADAAGSSAWSVRSVPLQLLCGGILGFALAVLSRAG
jgi:serine/threonine-protein kinase